jgi:hypothetical protein
MESEGVEQDDDMRSEYDFRGGVRGKYIRRLLEGANVVVLDSDLAVAFPDSESVNRALRALLEIAQREVHTSEKPSEAAQAAR